eukprot:scaffold3734_cov425-Prasinococcus_capsulatus_cf.AAC.14
MARLGKYASLALASAVIVFFPRVHRYNNASAFAPSVCRTEISHPSGSSYGSASNFRTPSLSDSNASSYLPSRYLTSAFRTLSAMLAISLTVALCLVRSGAIRGIRRLKESCSFCALSTSHLAPKAMPRAYPKRIRAIISTVRNDSKNTAIIGFLSNSSVSAAGMSLDVSSAIFLLPAYIAAHTQNSINANLVVLDCVRIVSNLNVQMCGHVRQMPYLNITSPEGLRGLPVEVFLRSHLIEVLRVDLVGPLNGRNRTLGCAIDTSVWVVQLPWSKAHYGLTVADVDESIVRKLVGKLFHLIAIIFLQLWRL